MEPVISYEDKNNRKILIYSVIFTAIWGILAHAYSFFNILYSHDSLMIIQQDGGWQISLGRFMQPLYCKIRGLYYVPSLVGFLALLYISISVFVLCKLLNIGDKSAILFFSGIMTTNAAITLTNATFMEHIDIFAMSLLCATLAVYICRHFKYGFLFSMGLYIVQLGLYQSYFQVSVFLFIIISLKDLLNGISFKKVFTEGLKGILSLVGGLALYFLTYKSVLFVSHIEPSNSYNGLSNVGQYDSFRQISNSIITTYSEVLYRFKHPAIFHSQIIGVLNIVLLILSIYFIIYIVIDRKIKKLELSLILILILLMPFGMNFVCFIAQGYLSDIMVYSFYLSYVLAYEIFMIYLKCEREKKNSKSFLKPFKKYILPVILGIVIFDSIIYANQTYFKKHLEYECTMETMNRIIYRIEDVDGYVPGKSVDNGTPVILIGSLEDSPLAVSREYFDNIADGLSPNFSVTYYATYCCWIKDLMNYPMNLLPGSDVPEWSEKTVVKEMPAFPEKNCCQLIDGVVVVKLSDY